MTTSNSTADVLHALSDDLTELLRKELQHAQRELAAKAQRTGRAGLMLGGAGALGGLAAGTSAVLLVRVLDGWLPPRTAALTATVLYGSGAAALASAGLAELKRASPLLPEETLESVRDDVSAARSATSGQQP